MSLVELHADYPNCHDSGEVPDRNFRPSLDLAQQIVFVLKIACPLYRRLGTI